MKVVKRSLILVLSVFLLVSFCQPVIADSGKLNINTATKEQLLTIKGFGAKIADRIIEYRKAHPFETVEEIMNVKGVGQKKFDKIKDLITVKDE